MTTRILATVGPNSLNQTFLEACDGLGVSLLRINLSHTPIEKLEEQIQTIRKWSDLPICLDSEGAQMRNQNMIDTHVEVTTGSFVKFHNSEVVGDAKNLSFTPRGSVKQFQVGDTVRVDFNGVVFCIVEKMDEICMGKVLQGGKIGSNKAADIDRDIELIAITDKDREAIEIGLAKGIYHFALSFASTAKDVAEMRQLCGQGATIISKIETIRALRNLPEILKETDEILIDRGDLSRQVPLEKIPFLQRRIIAMSKASSIPVHVATNLLETMISSNVPTRAELNDVVSTILMGADGLVLAAETAIGDYSIDAVTMIRNLADATEKWTSYSTIEDILNF